MRRTTFSTLALAALSLTACNAIFGISAAEVDPTFGAAGSGTAGSASGAAGSTSGAAGSTSGAAGTTAGTAGSSAGTGGTAGSSAGTGGTAGTAGASGTAGTAGSGGAKSKCDVYCDTVMKNCTGANLEYLDVGTCKAMCKFDPGLDGQDGDTLACRQKYALLAEGNPVLNCKSAGPLGFDKCAADPCVPFCFLASGLCKSKTQPPTAYPDTDTCEAACKGKIPYDTSMGDTTVTALVNNLNCRLYHVEAAYNPDDPGASDFHCDHTYPKSSKCGDATGAAGAGGAAGASGGSGAAGLAGGGGAAGSN